MIETHRTFKKTKNYRFQTLPKKKIYNASHPQCKKKKKKKKRISFHGRKL